MQYFSCISILAPSDRSLPPENWGEDRSILCKSSQCWEESFNLLKASFDSENASEESIRYSSSFLHLNVFRYHFNEILLSRKHCIENNLIESKYTAPLTNTTR